MSNPCSISSLFPSLSARDARTLHPMMKQKKFFLYTLDTQRTTSAHTVPGSSCLLKQIHVHREVKYEKYMWVLELLTNVARKANLLRETLTSWSTWHWKNKELLRIIPPSHIQETRVNLADRMLKEGLMNTVLRYYAIILVFVALLLEHGSLNIFRLFFKCWESAKDWIFSEIFISFAE